VPNSPKTLLFPLPADWRDKAVKRLNSLVPNLGNCPTCGPAGIGMVQVAMDLATPSRTDATGNVAVGGTIYPQMQLICTNCGFTRYFNYVLLMTDKEPS
jgi:hypothetical protein